MGLSKFFLKFGAVIALTMSILATDSSADIVSRPRPAGGAISSAGFGTAWVGAPNAFVNDDVYATNTLAGCCSDPLITSSHGFNIPSDATIVGVEIEIEASDPLDTSSVFFLTVDLRVGGSSAHGGFASGREDTANWPAADTLFTMGGPTDLWDTTLTVADVNGGGFGASIEVGTNGGGTARIDAVTIVVHYFDPGLQGGSLSAKSITSVEVPPPISSGSGPWSTPSEASVRDDVYASADTAPVSDGMTVFFITDELRVQDFGFNIPSNATIDGIVVEIERRASNTEIFDAAISLFKNGVRVHGATGPSLREGPNWTTWDAVRQYGSVIDPWDTTWTPADINDPSFGVSFAAANPFTGSRTAFIDRVEVRVHYTPGTVSQGPLADEDFSGSGGTATARQWSTVSGSPVISGGALQPGAWEAVTNSGVIAFADGATPNVEFDITVPGFSGGSFFSTGWRNTSGDSISVTVNTDSTQAPLTVEVDGAGSDSAGFGTAGSLVAGTTYHVVASFAPANSTDVTVSMLATGGPGGDIVEDAMVNLNADMPAGFGASASPFINQSSTGSIDNLEFSSGFLASALPAAAKWALMALAGMVAAAGGFFIFKPYLLGWSRRLREARPRAQ